MNGLLRATAVLADPSAAWLRIEKEAGDAVDLLISYVAPFALMPIVASFIGNCLIGVIVPGVGTVRMPVLEGLLAALFGYAATFTQVLLVVLLITTLAPLFGTQRDFSAAFKLAAYSFTPLWLAGIFLLLPGLRFLELTGFYGAYILAKGLPRVIRAPMQRSTGYAAVIVLFAGFLLFLTAAAQRALFGTPGLWE